MDLGAYTQIENLSEIAKKNGIEIPRLRGYRLMKDEKAVTQEKIKQMLKDDEVKVAEALIEAIPFWHYNSFVSEYSLRTDMLKYYYLIQRKIDGHKRFVGIRWDRIHGRKRKELKFAIKKSKQDIIKEWNTWNKYAGKEDVLYIHARLGG